MKAPSRPWSEAERALLARMWKQLERSHPRLGPLKRAEKLAPTFKRSASAIRSYALHARLHLTSSQKDTAGESYSHPLAKWWRETTGAR